MDTIPLLKNYGPKETRHSEYANFFSAEEKKISFRVNGGGRRKEGKLDQGENYTGGEGNYGSVTKGDSVCIVAKIQRKGVQRVGGK